MTTMIEEKDEAWTRECLRRDREARLDEARAKLPGRATPWYVAELVCPTGHLPPLLDEPGRELFVSVLPSGTVRVTDGTRFCAHALDLPVALDCLRTLRDDEGAPVRAPDQGTLEIRYNETLSGGSR